MKILGVDPGLERIGFALLERGHLLDFGLITTKSGDAHALRLRDIFHDFSELLESLKPDLVSLEKLFFVKNITNGLAVAEARGILLLALAEKGIQIIEVSPKEAKIAICGSGNAPKQQIQRAAQQIFRLPSPPQPDDAADAIALAFWAFQHQKKLHSC